MSKLNWKEARKQMRQMKPTAGMKDKDEFWTTFRARAANLPREESVPAAGVQLVPGLSLGWAGAMAALVAVVAGMLIWSSTPPTMENPIQSIDITAANQGVEVFQDPSSETTFLWISEME